MGSLANNANIVLKEAILEKEVPNDYEAAYEFILKKAEKMCRQLLEK